MGEKTLTKGLGYNQIQIINYFQKHSGEWRDTPQLMKAFKKQFESHKSPRNSLYMSLSYLVQRTILETKKPPCFGRQKRYWRLKNIECLRCHTKLEKYEYDGIKVWGCKYCHYVLERD